MPHRRKFNRTLSVTLICAATCLGSVRLAAADTSAEASAQKSEFEAYAESHPYLNDEFSAGEGSESGIDELERLQEPETPLLDPVDDTLVRRAWARGKFDSLYRETGLRLGFAATALGLWANGADDPDGSAYDIDFMSGVDAGGPRHAGQRCAGRDRGVSRCDGKRPRFVGRPADRHADQHGERLQRSWLGRA